jgi:type IV pilus assembly protein PilM
MFFQKNNPIGLDIGSSCIKAVQLRDTAQGPELAFMTVLDLGQGIIVDGAVADKKRLAASIREALRKAGAKGRDAVIGASGHSWVVIKKVSMPLMTAEELGISIKYEAEQFIPFDINDVNIDFEILGPRHDESGQMDVLLAAARKKVVADYAEAVEMAGLGALILDTDAFALSNMHELNYGSSTKIVALINVGATKTNISVLQEGRPVYIRDSALGCNHHTETLQRMFEISREDAESLKTGQPVAGVAPEEAQAVIEGASDEIYTEIHRSFEYFKSSVGEEEVSEIVLSGGAALIKGFSTMMAEKLGMQVEVADPFKKIVIPDRLDPINIRLIGPIAAVAVGLALRRAGDK